jgi:hypothetical protein
MTSYAPRLLIYSPAHNALLGRSALSKTGSTPFSISDARITNKKEKGGDPMGTAGGQNPGLVRFMELLLLIAILGLIVGYIIID